MYVLLDKYTRVIGDDIEKYLDNLLKYYSVADD